eukprot:7801928-Pyramimonas_sp.AAC.1
MEEGEIRFSRLDAAVPLRVAASGHGQPCHCETTKGDRRQIQTTGAGATSAEEVAAMENFVAQAMAGFR